MEDDEKTLENVLECLFKVLAVGDKARINNENMILKQVYSSSIVNSLEKLQEHKSPKVYKAIVKIINKYFETENPLIWSAKLPYFEFFYFKINFLLLKKIISL